MAAGCKKCGGKLPVQAGPGRPRLHCVDCVPSESKRVREIRPGADSPLPSLTEASRRRLTEAGKLETPEGVLVMNLARSIDEGGHSGASLASLSREYSRALEAAVADSEEQVSDDGVSWDVG